MPGQWRSLALRCPAGGGAGCGSALRHNNGHYTTRQIDPQELETQSSETLKFCAILFSAVTSFYSFPTSVLRALIDYDRSPGHLFHAWSSNNYYLAASS